MFITVVFILLGIDYSKCWSRVSDVRDDQTLDAKQLYKELKFSLDFGLFTNTKVTGDVQQYKSGLANEDVHLNVSQLIRKYGYSAEEHEAKTKDGYYLTLIRIPSQGPTVLLMHGLLGSSDDWVVGGINSSPAYLLANEGYDVWLGNARGNRHSRKHETLATSAPEFWNFSWDEIGRYDLPASIDYVLAVTNRTKLYYVGHSQGCTAVMVMCSELPKYNEKLSLIVALAPPAAIPNIKNPFLNFLKYVTLFHPEMLFSLVREMGVYEFTPSINLMKTFASNVCGREALAEIICGNLQFLVCGFNTAQLNITNLPVIFSHAPAGASTKQIEHFSQTVISGKFRKFDYGESRNFELYGAKEPPEYLVESISVPFAIFYSDNDWLVAMEDVQALRNRLPNVVQFHMLSGFNHVDYLFAKDFKDLIFVRLARLLKQY